MPAVFQAEGVQMLQGCGHVQRCGIREPVAGIDGQVQQAAGCGALAQCPNAPVRDALTVPQAQCLRQDGNLMSR